jgi:hypothetical protein
MAVHCVGRMVNTSPKHVENYIVQDVHYVKSLLIYEGSSDLIDEFCWVNNHHAEESNYELEEPDTPSQPDLQDVYCLFVVGPVATHFNFCEMFCNPFLVLIFAVQILLLRLSVLV